MFRFTIRDVLWLTVVLAMTAAVLYTRSARVNDLQAAMGRSSAQELELITARYKAAKGEFDWQDMRWHSGGSGVWDDPFEEIERLAHAVEELRDDPELRVKELARALELAQHVASAALDKYEHGTETASGVYYAQYTSADIEARLRRAERELATARATR